MNSATKRIGLALSGGGFRASLYHLGLVRFLRDAGILSQVTHIASVSGGSVLAAHLVLNWDRYNGSPKEFDSAAAELLSFVRLDVRNRIFRRFPLTIPLRWPYQLLGRPTRKLTRTGLLEHHYEKYLYGDTSLFELPEKPQLHILTTNLSEGSLCSFNRNGLLMMRRQKGHAFRIHRVHVGLATVAMAVTASSAFPGFFTPLELTGADVGASDGEFGRQAYTDGAVFDNLAVRMFRCLERPLLFDSPLCRDDFVDFEAVVEALRQASRSSEPSPLRRLAQVLASPCSRTEPLLLANVGAPSSAPMPSLGNGNGDFEKLVLSSLWDVLCHDQLHREPLFANIEPADRDAAALLHAGRLGRRDPDTGEQLWLNRHLMDAAFRQATGGNCFRRLNSGLDGVLVSDVGRPIKVQSSHRPVGLIRTALRSTEILMDRVWQLEKETFQDTSGFVFAPLTDVVEPADDPTALNPEIQRQAANIRTDMDRFSMLEISSLVRHGYCVGRKACLRRPDLFGADLPDNGPWDPIPAPRGGNHAFPPVSHLDGQSKEPAADTVEARTLRTSATRRVWSNFLDYRDWVSYVYVPILIPIFILLPYFVVQLYQRTHRMSRLIDSLSQGSWDLERMRDLLEGPPKPWTGAAAKTVRTLDEPDLKGFEILQDSRILDLRNWTPTVPVQGESVPVVYGFQRLRVVKRPDSFGRFRVRLLPTSPNAQVRFPPQLLKPELRRNDDISRWEVSVDVRKIPAGEPVDIIVEFFSPGEFLQEGENSTTLVFDIQTETAEVTRWVLLPEGKEFLSSGDSNAAMAGRNSAAGVVGT